MLKLSLKLACICVPILFLAQAFGKFTPAEIGDNRATYIAYATAQLCKESETGNIIANCFPDILIVAPYGGTTLLFDQPSWARSIPISWSYDYKYLAYSDGNDIYVYDVEKERAINITSDKTTSFEYYVEWSPVEHLLAFVSEDALSRDQRNLYVYTLDENLQREIVSHISVGGFSWSPDGSQILFSRAFNDTVSANLYTVETNGIGLKRLTQSDFDDFDPKWSADGKHILFLRAYPSDLSGVTVFMMDSDGNNRTTLFKNYIPSRPNFDWVLNDSSILYTADDNHNNLTFYMLDLKTNIRFKLWQADLPSYDLAPTRTEVAYVTLDNRFCLGNLLNGKVNCSEAKPYPGTVPAWGS
jgi:Tol biopolymer transport system component